ncbi:glucuronate isomerase [Herbaspirillum sp. SJZ107]|uniref:glucuronate isomerase n=1 Tax=Herbaspirillum sp. SJZ107 TaxID=2572881 RepID=UPI0011530CC5|nr:glucuronate isomerase [Herbaspirillum sp. SJZ107]TQK11603.1 D-glucuronate isomerase [Herbaspirillum sp. SJZ107]
MTAFMDKDFLLTTDVARKLYHEVAADLPVIDYHSHLQQGEIAERKKFRNIAELWLAGDHYKWRLMRTAGVAEEYCTGNRSDREKFDAFCKVLPLAIGNPIYHWSHLELRRIFGIDLIINEKNADAIWEQANAKLAGMDTWSFLEQAKVEIACTTDDPADDLLQHAEIANSGLKTRVLPAYRPDNAMRISKEGFADYVTRLSAVADIKIDSFASMMAALARRVEFFHARGGRISDHAIDMPLPVVAATPDQLESIFARRIAGETLSELEQAQYLRGLLESIGTVYAKFGWTMCFHIGAMRSNNLRMLQTLGPDTGFDSISDMTTSNGLVSLLSALDANDQLPKTMLFNLNPAMNEVLSTMIGNFQDGSVAGKVQFGPAWWFNDHKLGNLAQILAFGNHSVLGVFVGMVTDSRSFASYPRHDYFRRLVCRQFGEWVEGGEYPNDFEALSTIVRGICYENAKNYFGL